MRGSRGIVSGCFWKAASKFIWPSQSSQQLFVYCGWRNKGWQWRSLERYPLLSHFSSNKCLFAFLLYPLLPSTWKMPEFVIQDVLSGEYQDNTHLNVISIKARSPRKSKRVSALRLFQGTAEHAILPKIKSFKIIYLPYQTNCRNFIESQKIGSVPCRILINSRKRRPFQSVNCCPAC